MFWEQRIVDKWKKIHTRNKNRWKAKNMTIAVTIADPQTHFEWAHTTLLCDGLAPPRTISSGNNRLRFSFLLAARMVFSFHFPLFSLFSFIAHRRHAFQDRMSICLIRVCGSGLSADSIVISIVWSFRFYVQILLPLLLFFVRFSDSSIFAPAFSLTPPITCAKSNYLCTRAHMSEHRVCVCAEIRSVFFRIRFIILSGQKCRKKQSVHKLLCVRDNSVFSSCSFWCSCVRQMKIRFLVRLNRSKSKDARRG